ncbi:MAG: DUF4112 domain-containing protein [Bacteroidota bacterium]
MEEKIKPENQPLDEFKGLNSMAELLDNRFKIPGTDIRFGIDGIIGLIPYVGDVLTFIVSGYLITVLARKGASGMLVLKMLFNILFDGVIGTIPFLGDILDFRIRANTKNVNLMLEHYEEGRHQGSAWWVIILIVLMILGLIALSVWVVWRILYWIVT